MESVAHEHRKRDLDPAWVYDPSQFYRRAFQGSIVAGNYLYIDGGEIFYLRNGNIPTAIPQNSTYSIDISSSWTNETVRLNQIRKGSAPVLNKVNLFPDATGSSFFAYNGDVSQSLPYNEEAGPSPNALWQFQPDGNGGSWTINSQPGFARSTWAASTYGNGSAYILGGVQNWRTSTVYYADTAYTGSSPGILSYDINSNTWTNSSMDGFAPTGWSYNAELKYIEGIGKDGLLLAMGGMTDAAGPDLANPYLNSLQTVAIFDSSSGTWYNQTTTGDIPPGRHNACSVGMKGDHNTFEVFLYGGTILRGQGWFNTPQQANVDLTTVYVLSLPSFNWQKTSYTPKHARKLHTCNVIGNRQMVVVGGIEPDFVYKLMPQDPWTQGIGIFDMTDMQWKSSYDSSAAPYQTPKIIKTYNSKHGRFPAKWDGPGVQALFTNNNSSSSDSSSGTSKSKSSSNAGAIAGGVVGGLAFIALILGIIWFLMRRRRRRGQHGNRDANETDSSHQLNPTGPASTSPQNPELDATNHNDHLQRYPPPQELGHYSDSHDTRKADAELDSSMKPGLRHELNGAVVRHEME